MRGIGLCTYVLRCVDKTKLKTHATTLPVALVVFKLEAIQRVSLFREECVTLWTAEERNLPGGTKLETLAC